MRESAVDAGRALQVDAILQGRVSRSGEQTRITAELISAKDGARLWQSSYTFDRLLDAQDVLPLHVADALDLPKTEIQRTAKRHTNSPEAYEFYLQGRHLFERRRPKELQQAIDYFEKAIKADNSYALAYAGLAHAYILWVSQSAAIERLQKAKAAAQRALTIDDTLDEAHMALGRALVFCDWDWSGSERSFKRAIELNPNSPETHFWYSHNLTAAGRHDEALEELKLAYDIDPFYTAIVLRKGVALYLARRYDRATEEFLRTPFEVDAAYYQVYWRLGLAYAQREMYPDAVSMLEKTQTLSQEKSLGRASLAFVYAKSGKASEARRILQEVTSSESTELPWMMLAGAYGYLGEKDKAIECLERLYQSRDAPIMHLKVEPMLDSIRSDPRYDNLLRRVGLASL
jgi:tetratricopeptide (TPR) repeat protein